jgi:hypothetical protein
VGFGGAGVKDASARARLGRSGSLGVAGFLRCDWLSPAHSMFEASWPPYLDHTHMRRAVGIESTKQWSSGAYRFTCFVSSMGKVIPCPMSRGWTSACALQLKLQWVRGLPPRILLRIFF